MTGQLSSDADPYWVYEISRNGCTKTPGIRRLAISESIVIRLGDSLFWLGDWHPKLMDLDDEIRPWPPIATVLQESDDRYLGALSFSEAESKASAQYKAARDQWLYQHLTNSITEIPYFTCQILNPEGGECLTAATGRDRIHFEELGVVDGDPCGSRILGQDRFAFGRADEVLGRGAVMESKSTIRKTRSASRVGCLRIDRGQIPRI